MHLASNSTMFEFELQHLSMGEQMVFKEVYQGSCVLESLYNSNNG